MARVAAPLAFLLAATIAVLLIRSALDQPDEAATTAAPPPTAATTERLAPATTATTTAPTEPAARFYVVEEGDTLESIAAQHDTTVERLLELNQGIDPVALSIGQRIRVG